VISFVVVSYRSAALARKAIESFRLSARKAGELTEVVAVENSARAAEAAALASVADRTLSPGRNLGFAGGLNAGLEVARGDVLFLSNPDLVFAPGSVAPLAAAVREESGLAAAGPAFFLDEAMTIHLPPAEEPHPFDLVRRRLSMDPATTERAFRRRLRRVLRMVRETERGETARTESLSGALVVTTRRTIQSVGLFDEGYPLYYEENDWQRRLRAAGGILLRLGASRVIHRYGQSSRQEPRASGWFAESERRYFTRHFGARGTAVLETLAAAPPWRKPAPPPLEEGALRWVGRGKAGVALSPFPWFSPFAWVSLPAGASTWRPPAGLTEDLVGPCYARVLDPATGRVLAEATVSGAPTP
jgi:N-acetylglucosaminyl-diphospho-decaprenol L-rhamnosyltransferase